MAFVHFGIHTEFSITDSIVRIKALVKAAKADNLCRAKNTKQQLAQHMGQAK